MAVGKWKIKDKKKKAPKKRFSHNNNLTLYGKTHKKATNTKKKRKK